MPPKSQGDSNVSLPSCSRTGVSLIYPLSRVVVEEFYANDRSLRIKRDKFKDNSLVVVVGVIGKTEEGKSKIMNSLLDRPIFDETYHMRSIHFGETGGNSQGTTATATATSTSSTTIQMFHDFEHSILWLNLNCIQDNHVIEYMLNNLQSVNSEVEFDKWLQQQETSYMKALLFMFHVCHHILVISNGITFDLQYLRIFRILQNIRYHMSPALASVLNEVTSYSYSSNSSLNTNYHQSIYYPGRSIPLLSFVFLQNGNPFISKKSSSLSPSLSPDQMREYAKNNRESIAKSLDSQIKLILKRSKILCNFEPGSGLIPLFLLDTSRCVHVISNGSIVASSTSDGLPKANPILDQTDPLTLIISSILNTSMQDSISSSSSTKLDLSSIPIWISENREEMGGIKSLRDAIFQHSKSLHLQSASRDPKKQLPTMRGWTLLAVAIQEFLLHGNSYAPVSYGNNSSRRSNYGKYNNHGNNNMNESSAIMDKLQNYLLTEFKFSSSKCAQALIIAKNQYLNSLPSFYSSSLHQKQLLKASQILKQNARGPALESHLIKLKEECDAIWENGRQLCDTVSLTGRNCMAKLEWKNAENNKTHEHSSGHKSASACYCGKSRAQREDPFSLNEADHFYLQFLPKCCSKNILFCFPNLSENHYSTNWNLFRFGAANYYRKENGITQEGFINGHCSLSLFTFVKPAEMFAPAYMIDTKGFSLASILEISRKYRGKQTELLKLHPSDLFKYLGISNSLKSKGKSATRQTTSVNKHKQKNTNAPIPSINNSSSSSISISNVTSDIPPSNINMNINTSIASKTSDILIEGEKDGRNDHNFDSVSFYIGIEYECELGHRFLVALDDKDSNPTNAQSSINNPPKLHQPFLSFGGVNLQVPCICGKATTSSSNVTAIAQLQRIFLVTPNSNNTSLFVSFKFHDSSFQGNNTLSPLESISLPSNSFLCLSLPFIHLSAEGKILNSRTLLLSITVGAT